MCALYKEPQDQSQMTQVVTIIMRNLKYFAGAVLMLKISFLYPTESKSSVFKHLYFTWGVFYFLSFALTFFQMVVYLYITPFDLVEEAMIIMNTGIYMSLFINFTFLLLKRDKVVAFVAGVNRNFVDGTDNGIDDVTMVESLELSDKIAYYWTGACVLSSTMPVILSLLGGNRTLPILAWFPYDCNRSPLFELTYIWQLFALVNLGAIYAILDLVFPCLSLVVSQQFKILSSNFKNTIYKTLLDLDVPKRLVSNMIDGDLSHLAPILESDEFKSLSCAYLKRNIAHHQLLLQYCNDLNDILNTFLLGKVTAAIFNTVLMAFSIITSGDQAMVLGLGTYVISTSTELFIYTHSGQILSQSADMTCSLYETPWHCCDLKFQKLFNIVQMRLSQNVYIKAGNYFCMTATAFITFMKSLGSYVAVLKELNDRSD